MSSRVAFTVLGDPQPQGSKTTIHQKGRRPRVIEDNPLTMPWRQAVAAAALDAMNGQVRTGPLRLTATFVLKRPQTHWGSGRNAGRLKPSAPLYCPTRPDADKLLRAVGDALTGVVFRDDTQLVIVHAEKHYGAPACAHIVVEEIALDDDRPAPDDVDHPNHNREGSTMTEEPDTTAEPSEPEPTDEPEPDSGGDDDSDGAEE